MTFKVAEKFASINGEGTRAGQLAVFIRLAGCNLRCSYCDTRWANEKDVPCCEMSAEQIAEYVKSSGLKNVTLTGGEPLLAENIAVLLSALAETGAQTEIETNGSIPLSVCAGISPRPVITMDYKLPSSKMERYMLTDNFGLLGREDTVKFVAGDRFDLERAFEIISRYKLTEKCRVYLSPVFGKIQPSEIVDFMLERKLCGVNFQLQLHKYVWDPDMRGV